MHHLIDCEWTLEAYRLTRKDGAPDVDGMMATAYDANLEANLDDLSVPSRVSRQQVLTRDGSLPFSGSW
ncbi:hypothetical protein [Bradyrhizobium sp. 131]|uniref:hypothetical protein n=1 Tax=Bradyrhizobium sp. 131 TaxID=2782609 RepID=UPI001FFED701|nr:hypothetical protein [Bradyrhizobium sp. 131]UPK20502.1 hypothetical protein IVA73_05415 [Bradyrhizobium sp. 131]